jgi:transposase
MSRQYNEDFKREAVHLVLEKGNPVPQVAHDLGLSTKTLYAWISKVKAKGSDKAFIGSGNVPEDAKQQREDAKKIRDLEEQVAILKKALRIFAETPR